MPAQPRFLSSRNDEFQVLASLLSNRTKRHRAGQFLVQGVRPIDEARAHGWTITSLLFPADRPLSRWATDVLAGEPDADRVALVPDLLDELSEKSEGAELLALVGMRVRRLQDLGVSHDTVVVVCDRPNSPGNLGAIIRSADAFGADGIVVTGHAADPFDPQAVRASRGSVFAVPVVTVGGMSDLEPWLADAKASVGLKIVGADEGGEPMQESALTPPVALVVGNETKGLSRAAIDMCDLTVRIPMRGSASSLNVASATSIFLYEIDRQRRQATRSIDPA